MVDAEVMRLRDLRARALKLRAVAGRLNVENAPGDFLLHRAACAGWRIARAVSGRLRSHPYVDYQKDASLGVLLRNSIAARGASFRSTSRRSALRTLETQVKGVLRLLNDARSLAWDSNLGDTLSRSQREMRALAAAVEQVLSVEFAETAESSGSRVTPLAMSSTDLTPSRDRDWPFLAL